VANNEDDVNVTPLLDIVFIMLIFFIVTSTFIKEPGVDIQRPLVSTQEENLKPAILIAITANDEIWINREQVELAEVQFRIQELRKETPRGGVVVQTDREAKSRMMIDVLQQVKDAGIDNVAVSTEEA
jgi:biopolymer transport protein ExbD